MNDPQFWSWLACGVSMLGVFLYGTRPAWGAAVGSTALIPWMGLAFTSDPILWGLVPANVIFFALHIRNLIKYRKAKP